MGQVDLPEVQPIGNKSTEEYVKYLADIIAILKDEIDNILGGRLSSNNIREIAGYNVNQTELKHKSGIVGMSGDDPTNPNAVRFWAGNANPAAAPYRVQQDGKMYATDGEFTGNISGSTITGGTIRTAVEGNKRIELTGGILSGYFSDDQLHGLVFNPNTPSNFFDMFIYHDGVQLIEFFDDSGSIKIRPGSGSSFWTLGKAGGTTYTAGSWDFSNASVTGIPQSAITNLESRLSSIEARLTALETP